ncbi:hypothetical protein M2226_008936 [Bradyrhizobium elkanii]|uniref:hypothetical protein n=1 Tax=Bradyrhizobium elkanii TaxID=29448 RepID=UPI0022268B28|nr:hypothetical protein [Bradyrhizobium elkanii]MCW2130192.1 hypothetical protein [Bradyrhizobium elkanii]MCW2167869.1 hypothetical protein [Bradyrhizobium elkanii]
MTPRRKIDRPGEIVDPQSKEADEGEPLAPLHVELPLWRSGRIRFSSRSQKASLALIALAGIVAMIILLSLFEALPGAHPGVAGALEKLSQALLLVLGVLLGVDWNAGKSDNGA